MFFRSVLLSSLFATVALAQVPPGWAAYTKRATSNQRPGGALMFDPINGDYTNITNLPYQFIGGSGGGANTILIDDTDGSIWAGDWGYGRAGLHHVFLNGSDAGASTLTYPGADGAGGSINDIELLPDGRLLLIYQNISSRTPPSGMLFHNPTTNRFGRGPVDPTFGPATSIALDLTGTIAYAGYALGEIWAVPVDKSPATLITTVTGGIVEIDTDHLGNLIVATPSRGVRVIDPVTLTDQRLAGADPPTAMSIEPVSGDVIICGVSGGVSRMERIDVNGVSTRIGGMGQVDRPTGIAVRSSLLPYGTQHPSNPFDWQRDGNPGGAPRYGNQNFSLTLNTSGGTPPALLLLGLRRLPNPGALPPFADNLLVDLGGLLLNTGLPAGPSPTVGLPLPNIARGTPVALYAQVLTADPSTIFPFRGGAGLQINIY